MFDGKICNSYANFLQISRTKFPRREGRCSTDEIYPFKNIIKILKLDVTLYVSLRARRNFPTSCPSYIVLCFKYLEMFINKKLLISSENIMRMTSEKHLIRNDPNKFKGEVQSRITIILKERVKISLQIGGNMMKIG